MFKDVLQSSKVASKYLKASLFVILFVNVLLQLFYNSAVYTVAKESVSLNTQRFHESPKEETVTPIKIDRLYVDSIPPNGSKIYKIEAPPRTVLIIFLISNTENADLKLNLEGPVDEIKVNLVWIPEPHIYYVRSSGEIRIKIVNPQTYTVHYRAFVDISESLSDYNTKTLPINNSHSQVAFHIDLRKDDKVILNLNYSGSLHPKIRVFALYYDIFPYKSFYSLYLYKESLYKSLYFTADSGGRYYIFVESAEGNETVSLTGTIISPPWNQEWFWIVFVATFFITATFTFFLARANMIKKIERASLLTLLSCYCWFITVGLSISLVGSFAYGTLISMSLFYSLIISYGSSLITNIYAAYLDRKKTFAFCPYCGRKVNVREDNYCCGKIVKKVSAGWFLLPLSFSFLFFIISYLILERFSSQLLAMSLWIGSFSSIIGGIIAWQINRPIHRIKTWKFLVVGTISFFFSFILIGFLIEFFLTQPIESFGRWSRIRIAPMTLPTGAAITFIVLAIGLSFLIVIISERVVFTEKLSFQE